MLSLPGATGVEAPAHGSARRKNVRSASTTVLLPLPFCRGQRPTAFWRERMHALASERAPVSHIKPCQPPSSRRTALFAEIKLTRHGARVFLSLFPVRPRQSAP